LFFFCFLTSSEPDQLRGTETQTAQSKSASVA
jgi:hypothetical protein